MKQTITVRWQAEPFTLFGEGNAVKLVGGKIPIRVGGMAVMIGTVTSAKIVEHGLAMEVELEIE